MQDMKLNDLYKMSLEEALKRMDIVNMEIYTDDEGEIKALDVKYVPIPANRPVAPYEF